MYILRTRFPKQYRLLIFVVYDDALLVWLYIIYYTQGKFERQTIDILHNNNIYGIINRFGKKPKYLFWRWTGNEDCFLYLCWISNSEMINRRSTQITIQRRPPRPKFVKTAAGVFLLTSLFTARFFIFIVLFAVLSITILRETLPL